MILMQRVQDLHLIIFFTEADNLTLKNTEFIPLSNLSLPRKITAAADENQTPETSCHLTDSLPVTVIDNSKLTPAASTASMYPSMCIITVTSRPTATCLIGKVYSDVAQSFKMNEFISIR